MLLCFALIIFCFYEVICKNIWWINYQVWLIFQWGPVNCETIKVSKRYFYGPNSDNSLIALATENFHA